MKYYIAELTETGLYTLRIAKEAIPSKPYILDNKKVYDYSFILDDGTEFLYKATGSNKLFESLEECQEFIEGMNRL